MFICNSKSIYKIEKLTCIKRSTNNDRWHFYSEQTIYCTFRFQTKNVQMLVKNASAFETTLDYLVFARKI